MFDLSGRVILQDAFSTVLDHLTGKSKEAGASLTGMGEQMDAAMIPAKARILALGQEVDRLKLKARGGGANTFTLLDLSQLQGAQGELQALQSGMDGVTGKVRGASSAMELFGKVSLISGAAFAVFRAADSVMGIARMGAAAKTQADILQNLGRANQINTQALVNGLRTASMGTLDTATIMTTANRALLAGGGKLASELPRLFQIARAASSATGQDISYVYETLVKGIIRASPLLIDNADIYIKVGQAVDQYAESVGKTSEALTAQERQTAVLNAVLAQGGAFIKQMGMDSETAADQMQSLPAALADVKLALAELATQAGVPKMLGDFAKSLQVGNEMQRVNTQFKALENTLAGYGDTATLKESAAALQELMLAYTKTGSSREGMAAYVAGLEALVQKMQAARDKAVAESDPETAYAIGLRNSLGILKASGGIVDEGAESLKTYNEALKGITDKATSLAGLSGQLGELAGAMKVAQTGLPQPPQIGTALSTDVAALREYLDAVAQINPALAPMIAQTAQSADALARQQSALLSNAAGMTSHAAALDMIAKATFGAGATISDLVSKFDTLPPPVQRAVLDLGLLENALGSVQAQAAKPIKIDVQINGLSQTLDSIDQMALRLAGVLAPDQIRSFRDQARAEVSAHWSSMEGLDRFGMELEKSIILKGYSDIADGTLQHYRAMETATANHYTNLADSAQGLRSMIEGALQKGLEVTPEQMLATQAGKYQNVALENARRLQAIAERGFAEIKAHPDWANILKIPSEVLNGGEDGLKAWAARIKGDVTDLTRPDLIDWDAFIRQFQADQDRTAAKGLTIDIAVGKLKDSGLLKGMTDEERKKKVAAALGMSAPEVTLDTLFAPKGTPGDLVKKFLGDKDAMEIPIKWIYPAGPAGALPENSGMMPPGSTPVAAKQPEPTAAAGKTPAKGERVSGADRAQYLLDTQGAEKAPALTSSAATAASSWILAFQQGIKDTDPAMQVATALNTEFGKNTKAFTAMGNEAGGTVGDAFITGVTTKAGGVVQKLAEIIAPEVAKILQRQNSGNSKP